jgi:hypothetical protein
VNPPCQKDLVSKKPTIDRKHDKARQVKITTNRKLFFCVFDKMMQVKIK